MIEDMKRGQRDHCLGIVYTPRRQTALSIDVLTQKLLLAKVARNALMSVCLLDFHSRSVGLCHFT